MTPDLPQTKTIPSGRPYRVYKREQERISRKKLYKTTALYTSYSVILLVLAFRSHHLGRAVAYFFGGGIPFWMLTEYFSHRYVLHRHWKVSKRRHKRFLTRLANKYLD